MLFKSFFGMLLALFLAPAINSQRLCCYRMVYMVIGNLWEITKTNFAMMLWAIWFPDVVQRSGA